MAAYAVSKIKPTDGVLEDERYRYLFSVEEVNRLVLKGVPFREAYKQVAVQIQNNDYRPDTTLTHTHEGSLGNLCNPAIQAKLDEVLHVFDFEKKDQAIRKLLDKSNDN